MADEKKDVSAWGYSKDGPKLFADGKLPKGYYPNPAMVPGSDAEKQYKIDAERDGAKIPWETAAAPAPVPVPDDKAK